MIFLGIILLVILLVTRDKLVYNVRMSAICRHKLNSLPTYSKMMLQVWKWNKKQWEIK